MNKLITLSAIIPLLFLIVPKVYADSHCDRDGWPACYDLGYHKGSIDASFDYNNNRGYDSSCPSGHSENFCAGYSVGYNNWWHQAYQNTGIQQGQSSNIN